MSAGNPDQNVYVYAVFSFLIADCRCYAPTSVLSVKMAYRNPKTDLTRGASQKKLPSEAYRTKGGAREIVSPIGLQWDALAVGTGRLEDNCRKRVEYCFECTVSEENTH